MRPAFRPPQAIGDMNNLSQYPGRLAHRRPPLSLARSKLAWRMANVPAIMAAVSK
jgi:hypothetical protein